MTLSVVGMRNNKRLIQAPKALRRAGFHFTQFQLAGIHCNVDGSSKELQNDAGLAGDVSVVLFPPLKALGAFDFLSGEMCSGRRAGTPVDSDNTSSSECGSGGR